MYIEELRKIKDINKNSISSANLNFSGIFNSFIGDLEIVDKKKYRVKTSVGMGTLAKLWWCIIMDRNFYRDIYGINDDRKLSADKGYYIAYLVNEEMNKIVLCISQPSKNITRPKNSDKLFFYQSKNEQIYNALFKNENYRYYPKPRLSENELLSARDFEASIIIYKEYDLNTYINDKEFKEDLVKFIEIYNKLLNYITAQKYITINSRKMSLFTNSISDIEDDDFIEIIDDDNEQLVSYKSKRYIKQSELEYANNKPVEYTQMNGNNVYKRDERIQKTVIEDSEFLCSYDKNHITFLTKNGMRFMEGHHLVPLKFQLEFNEFRLDRYENIVSLCPICHSAIHYGDDEVKRRILEKLYNRNKMKDILKQFNINSFIEFYDKYYL